MLDIINLFNIALCFVLACLIYKNRDMEHQQIILVLFVIIVISIVLTLIYT